MTKYPKLVDAKAEKDFSLVLRYDNGEVRRYDFSENFSHPYFAPLANSAVFETVRVAAGSIEWADGRDFCPFTLYEKSERVFDKNALPHDE